MKIKKIKNDNTHNLCESQSKQEFVSASLENEQMQEWFGYTKIIKEKFGVEAYHAADLAIKFIAVRALQDGLLRGFADDALLGIIANVLIQKENGNDYHNS